jgi:hypothetical protein
MVMASGKKQLKILVDEQLASAFKKACSESGISMAKELSRHMEGRVGMAGKAAQKGPVRTVTRRDRRSAMRIIVSMLAIIRDAEEAYCEAIPENLKNGSAYDNAEQAVFTMDEAIALLNEAYG